jgi:hypothetical protein
MGTATRYPASKNPIRVWVWAKSPPPTGLLMGSFITHRVKRVWVRSHVPHTRYLVDPHLEYINATNPNNSSIPLLPPPPPLFSRSLRSP